MSVKFIDPRERSTIVFPRRQARINHSLPNTCPASDSLCTMKSRESTTSTRLLTAGRHCGLGGQREPTTGQRQHICNVLHQGLKWYMSVDKQKQRAASSIT